MLRASTALASLAVFAAIPVHAQDSTAEAASAAVEEQGPAIIVTGSRIVRDANERAPSPVQTVSTEQVRNTGVVDMTEALREIPALSNSITIADSLERTDKGSGVGQAVLDLRGMGAERTLVLVNGRRHVSGVTGTQIVDVASIPAALVDRVEVLTGGASSLYGADAVTGVVNYILKENFEGIDVSGQMGISSRGDGATRDLQALVGRNFAGGRGNITVGGSLSEMDGIEQGERAFSRDNARYNTAPYRNPARRFQQGEISAEGTPNFFNYFSTANGRYRYGLPIPTPQGTTAGDYSAIFTGGVTPTPAEQALIDRAANAPSQAILPHPTFAISSNSGVIFRNDFGTFNADTNGNGVSDCEESFIGFMTAGCYVSTPDGGVRIFEDGISASGGNQYGGDGAAERLSPTSLVPRNTRTSLSLLGSFKVSPAAELFMDARYARSATRSQNPSNTFYDALYIAPDNSFIPDALQADADQAGGLRVSRDFADFGPGITDAKRDTYRLVGGLRGEISPELSYEIFGNYGRTDSRVTYQTSVLYDRLFAALDAVDEGAFLTGTANGKIVCRSDLDASALHPGSEMFPVIQSGFFTFNPGDGQCVPVSIFNGQNSISAAGADFITTPTTNRARIEQFVAGATLTGDSGAVFELPGGPVGFAAGGEYRKERSRFRYDPLELGILPIDTPAGKAGTFVGDISGNQKLTFDASAPLFNSDGQYDVWEVFGEVRLPILSDRPFFEQLEVSGAARYSDYSTIGGAFTWNVNGVYSPVPGLALRGTYAQAIRAPNIFELFSPQQGTYFLPSDPCDATQIDALSQANAGAGALRQANCVAGGLPVGFSDPLTARFAGTDGGNPDLEEETASTYTFGAVLSPRFVPGLVLSADYYNITIKDAIAAVGAQDIVDSCYDSAAFPNQYCELFDRRPDGGLSFLRQTRLNFGRIETAGIDASISYSRPVGPVDVGLRLNGTWVDKLDHFFDPGDPTLVDPELGEQGRPEWTVTGGASIGYGPLTLNYTGQWIEKQALGGVEIETADVIAGPAGFADDKFVHDVSVFYKVNQAASLYAGVNNLTDVEPYPTNLAYPVSPYGRYFFVGLRLRD
jgi:outer membrane receptor protein involved in Fe transport